MFIGTRGAIVYDSYRIGLTRPHRLWYDNRLFVQMGLAERATTQDWEDIIRRARSMTSHLFQDLSERHSGQCRTGTALNYCGFRQKHSVLRHRHNLLFYLLHDTKPPLKVRKSRVRIYSSGCFVTMDRTSVRSNGTLVAPVPDGSREVLVSL